MYYNAEVARVNAEMVRPDVNTLEDGTRWGGYNVGMMRIAGLARTIQSRLYIHTCSPKYCLQGRTSCRSFFPWPEQRQQQFDENTDRVALRRLYPADDRWVVPHDIELAMFSPATVNVLPFDPYRNVSEAMLYAGKYVSKPEKWYYIEKAQEGVSGVKQFLQSRTVGLCLCINRLMSFHAVRFTRGVRFLPTSFLAASARSPQRTEGHLRDHPEYPDPHRFLNAAQHYLFRHRDLQHLRFEQYNRYFAARRELTGEANADTREDTLLEDKSCRTTGRVSKGATAIGTRARRAWRQAATSQAGLATGSMQFEGKTRAWLSRGRV